MKKTIKNGFEISEFTLGTVQLGMDYGINNKSGAPSTAEAFDILKTSLDAGITSFDTAGAYGRSEDILGEYFEKSDKTPSIITKVHPKDVSPDLLFDSLVQEVKTSCKRLKLTSIPFLMLHRESYIKKYGDKLMNALLKLKNEGLVANLGVSFSDKDEIRTLCDPNVFDCVQLPLNLFDNKEIDDGTVKYLEECGVAVFVRSIYLQGVFFMEPDALPTHLSSAKEPLQKIREIAKAENMSLSEFALSFIRSADGVTSVVLGCETAAQVKENAKLFTDKSISASSQKSIARICEEIDPIVVRPWEWPKGV